MYSPAIQFDVGHPVFTLEIVACDDLCEMTLFEFVCGENSVTVFVLRESENYSMQAFGIEESLEEIIDGDGNPLLKLDFAINEAAEEDHATEEVDMKSCFLRLRSESMGFDERNSDVAAIDGDWVVDVGGMVGHS
ncbi:hypothetical protein DEO72_LG7g3233 [Vigna unguiculata]|uniref:Uncharacterized protein n=1 Tax=Vigna unguiculata TaxID=3917 RepID=A0A4D6MKL7_VIGUN|nr:hypothetical protein DEO72_LG7g3233 [Vigna unguiculata]